MAEKSKRDYERSRVIIPLVAYPLSTGPLHALSDLGLLFWLPPWATAVIQAIYLPLNLLCMAIPPLGRLVGWWLKVWTG